MTVKHAERAWQLQLRAKGEDRLELTVYDVIGKDFFGEGVSAKDILVRLRAAPEAKQIDLRINSVGGIVDEAKAMVNLLGERAASGATVTAYVDSLAASAASYLTTAAERVVMPSNAFLMLHEVRSMARGRASDFEAFAEVMRKTNAQIAEAYAAASARRGKKKSADDYLAAIAKGDLYLTAAEAIEWGLADEETQAVKVAACLVDISEAELPEPIREQLRSAPYVLTARVEPAPPAPAPNDSPPPPGPLPGMAGKENRMKLIAKLLGLPDTATEEELAGALEKRLAAVSEKPVMVSGVKLLNVATEEEAAARVNQLSNLSIAIMAMTGKETIAEATLALNAWKVGSEQAGELATRVTQLENSTRVAKLEASIEKLSREGRLAPAQHDWARKQFNTAEQLDTFALTMPPMVKIGPVESPSGGISNTLTDEEKNVCKLTGVSEAAFLETKRLQAGV
jgi:ATP-dependent Clp protease protease subunit